MPTWTLYVAVGIGGLWAALAGWWWALAIRLKKQNDKLRNELMGVKGGTAADWDLDGPPCNCGTEACRLDQELGCTDATVCDQHERDITSATPEGEIQVDSDRWCPHCRGNGTNGGYPCEGCNGSGSLTTWVRSGGSE